MDSNKLKHLIQEEVQGILKEKPLWKNLPPATRNNIGRHVRSVKRFLENQGVQTIMSSYYDKEKGHYFLSSVLNNGDFIDATVVPRDDVHSKVTIRIRSKHPNRDVNVSNILLPNLYKQVKEEYNNEIQREADEQKLK